MIILEEHITSPSVLAVEQSCTSNGRDGVNGGQDVAGGNSNGAQSGNVGTGGAGGNSGTGGTGGASPGGAGGEGGRGGDGDVTCIIDDSVNTRTHII
jgi:hypothetical protein